MLARKRQRLFRAAPEDERIAAFQSQHALALSRERHKLARDFPLPDAGRAAPLAGVDDLSTGAREFQQRIIDQRVVEDDVRARDGMQTQRRN
jgi:hypothetical protein